MWIIIILILGSAMLCMAMNNILFRSLTDTITELKEKIKPQLLLLNEPEKGRFITTDQLPLLQIWHNESMNYGVINIVAIASATVLAICLLYNVVPIFVAILNVIFNFFNLIFLPSAIGRKFRVDRILFNYRAMVRLKAIVEHEKNKSEPVVDP